MSINTLQAHLISYVYKTEFKISLRDALPFSKTKKMKAIERGIAKIVFELDVVNFIRFHLQTRSLLKHLVSAEKRKKAKDLKCHLDSDQIPDSDQSVELDPQKHLEIASFPAQVIPETARGLNQNTG